MGGFGSLLLGSRNPDIFGKIAWISGAFIIDDLIIGNPEVTGGGHNIVYFQNLFGDIPSLNECPDRNPMSAATRALKLGKLPPIFAGCGRHDMLYSRNIRLRDRLTYLGADIKWMDTEGIHDWICFNRMLEPVFAWFLS